MAHHCMDPGKSQPLPAWQDSLRHHFPLAPRPRAGAAEASSLVPVFHGGGACWADPRDRVKHHRITEKKKNRDSQTFPPEALALGGFKHFPESMKRPRERVMALSATRSWRGPQAVGAGSSQKTSTSGLGIGTRPSQRHADPRCNQNCIQMLLPRRVSVRAWPSPAGQVFRGTDLRLVPSETCWLALDLHWIDIPQWPHHWEIPQVILHSGASLQCNSG